MANLPETFQQVCLNDFFSEKLLPHRLVKLDYPN